MPAALWDNKITVWSNRKLFLFAVSKRRNETLPGSYLKHKQCRPIGISCQLLNTDTSKESLGLFSNRRTDQMNPCLGCLEAAGCVLLASGLVKSGLLHGFNTLTNMRGAKGYPHDLLLNIPCSFMPPYSTSLWDCLSQSLLVVWRWPRRREKKNISLCPSHHCLYLSQLHKGPGEVWLRGGAFYSWRRCCVAGTYRYCKKFRWCHLSVV